MAATLIITPALAHATHLPRGGAKWWTITEPMMMMMAAATAAIGNRRNQGRGELRGNEKHGVGGNQCKDATSIRGNLTMFPHTPLR